MTYKLKIMEFTAWWEQNKVLYPQITKEIAQTIWAAACDNMAIVLKDKIIKEFT